MRNKSERELAQESREDKEFVLRLMDHYGWWGKLGAPKARKRKYAKQKRS